MFIHCFFVARALGAKLHRHILGSGFAHAGRRAHHVLRHAVGSAPARAAAVKVCVATGLAGLGAIAPSAGRAVPPSFSPPAIGYPAAPAPGFGGAGAMGLPGGAFGVGQGSDGGSLDPMTLFDPATPDGSSSPPISFDPDEAGWLPDLPPAFDPPLGFDPPPAFDPPPIGGWPRDPAPPSDPRQPPDPPGDPTAPPAVPEPSSLWLLAAGLLAAAAPAIKRRRAPG